MSTPLMRPKSFECDEGFFTLLSRSILRRICEISLPQKTSPACMILRSILLGSKKQTWVLKTSPWGFRRLDVSNEEDPPLWFALFAMADPFRRFNFEEYLQTVILSDPTKIVYKEMFSDVSLKRNDQNSDYKLLSEFLDLTAKLGGVSMNYYFYAHCYFKRMNLDNKGKRQASNKQTGKQTKQNTL